MRGVKLLQKALQHQSSLHANFDAHKTACSINAAARLYSSATLALTQSPFSNVFDNKLPATRSVLSNQLTSLSLFPHARSFSSQNDNSSNFDSDSSTEFTDRAADTVSEFNPSAILDAVAGVEEDGWLAAREDVWFFNRYMQSVLRFAQDATGLPWYSHA